MAASFYLPFSHLPFVHLVEVCQDNELPWLKMANVLIFQRNHVAIQIEVIINTELKQLLLSQGSHVTVLSPETLREEIKADLMKNFEKY